MANHELPHKASGSGDRDRADLLTRYFLRRLAMARRQGLYTDRGAEYSDALVEVIIAVIAAPLFGILSFAMILSLKWFTRSEVASLPVPSKWTVAVGGWIFCVIVGRLLLGRRFKKFLADPGAALSFDTERDRQIANGVKLSVIAVSAFILPALAFLIAFWGRL